MTAPAPEPLDAESLRRLAEAHSPELTRYVSGMLGGDTESARDIVQDAFVRLWRKPPGDDSNLRAWLYSLCRSRAIDVLRRRGRMVSDDGFLVENTVDEAPSPSRKLAEAEAARDLFALVDTLPGRARELVKLKFREDLSYAEIAAVTGLTVSNVGFILHGAVKTLRERIAARADFRP